MVKRQHSERIERLFLAGCLTICGAAAIFGAQSVRHEQQYAQLAESFLSGKLYFISMPGSWHDTAAYGQRYYWPLGPFPAVLLMPFVWLSRLAGADFYQGYVSLPLSFLTAGLCFRLAEKCGRTKLDSAWLTVAFCGSSSYLSIATISMSWSFAHVVVTCLLLLTLLEWLGSRKWWLIGLLMGLTAATRISAGLHIAFYAAAATLDTDKKGRLKTFVILAAAFAIPVFLLGAYNFVRFGTVFETGYSYQAPDAGDFPTTSLTNVLPHLRIFLFGMPSITDRFPFIATDPVGMSVLLLSPWLLFLGSLKFDGLTSLALASCVIVLLAVLSWRSTGQIQLGYRFSLDILPMVMFLLARDGFGGDALPIRFKVFVAIGFASTVYFLSSLVDQIPQG